MAISADEGAWFEKVLEKWHHDNTKCSDWELGFFKDQIARWEQYGENIRWSDKQYECLDRIAKKLGAPARPPPEPEGPDDDEVPF